MDDSDLYGDLYGADYDDGAETTEVEKSLTSAAATTLGGTDAKKDSPEPEPVKTNILAVATSKLPASVTAPLKADNASIPATAAPQLGTYQTNTAYTNGPAPTNPIASYSSRDDPPTHMGNNNMGGGYGNNNAYQPKNVYQQKPDQSYGGGGNGPTQQHAGSSFHAGGGTEADGSVRPSDMRDEGKMFVGGLNWETTTETLKEYFSQFGKVDACTIMRDGAGRSRGFAFLTFEDAAAVNAVMVREHFLDGKVIDPKRAIPRLEHQRTQKIFVGGLAPSVTAETLKEYFSQHGSVVDATVMIDRESGRSKGFGFVTFEEGPPLDHLIGHGITLNNKVIEVKLAQPRHSGRNRDDDGGGGGGGGGGGDYRSGGANGGGGYNNHNNSHNNNGPPANAPPAFDAQAMANLYQRMMSVAQTGGFMGMGMGGMNPMMGGGGMGMGMGGGMNPMMGGMGRGMVPGAGGMMGGGGAGMMAPGPGMGRGGPMIPGGGAPGMGMGMGMGGGVGMGMGGAGGPPRGPRAGVAGGPQQVPPGVGGGPTAPGGGAAGPMRSHGMRGQNTYHPYGR